MRLTISQCTEHFNNQLPNSLKWTEMSCSTDWAKKSWGKTVLPQPFSRTPSWWLISTYISRTPFLMADLYIHFWVLQSQFFVSAWSFLLSFKVGSWALFRPVELRISLTNINYTPPSLQELKVFQKLKNHRSKVFLKKIVTGRLSEVRCCWLTCNNECPKEKAPRKERWKDHIITLIFLYIFYR